MESTTGSMSASNFIPEDVLIEILLRLPLISLYLFKSVCKHWLSLITSPSFILRLRNQQLPIIAPVCGLFLQQPDSSAFVPLDVRITACPFGSIITQAGKWSISGHQLFGAHSFRFFETGVYWDNAIHWINYWDDLYSVLGIEPGRTWLTCKKSVSKAHALFESRGCLLLLVWNSHANYHVLERNKYSEWSMKYSVYLDDIVPWARMLSVLCVVLGEREEDSFMVVEVNRKVLQYKFLSKSVSTVCNYVSSSSLISSPFIPSLASV